MSADLVATGTALADVQTASGATIPAARFGQPDEFGTTVAFPASLQAAYITGSTIRVDCGMIRGL